VIAHSYPVDLFLSLSLSLSVEISALFYETAAVYYFVHVFSDQPLEYLAVGFPLSRTHRRSRSVVASTG